MRRVRASRLVSIRPLPRAQRRPTLLGHQPHVRHAEPYEFVETPQLLRAKTLKPPTQRPPRPPRPPRRSTTHLHPLLLSQHLHSPHNAPAALAAGWRSRYLCCVRASSLDAAQLWPRTPYPYRTAYPPHYYTTSRSIVPVTCCVS